ncbi:ATP-binding cassette domain-containing protein [Streptomyces sp. H39-S7]|uniref:ATP-binding cassette domain-containing protein n=1 Tax=Streptomyces sp. H39-S7 TaxID=3004357 RepID=UPI0022AE5B96|nr:ATP-binding cassette domain-containing protein [Streptomyces sp. H39-S7]MCZ4125418.1 ATP-binding cassette domain-containing protein [Streptomyces sp. H39-S7]
MSAAIEAEGLRKRYGDLQALDGVDLSVPAGTVLGVLGPNGAGKTTAVRVLATLLTPDAGRARVAGYDVTEQPAEVRKRIGLTGQYAAVDELLTGRENLTLIGRLHRLGRRGAKTRAAELLERFELTEAGEREVKTYSGGMRRRLDLAASLLGTPTVLFLDEPSTGLDLTSRMTLWAMVREQVAAGVTVLLTTQYLEEADHLADRIAVIDHGVVIADGTPDELKRKVGGERLEVTVAKPVQLAEAVRILSAIATGEPTVDPEDHRISVTLGAGIDTIADAAAVLRDTGIEVADFALRRPSLDDVFLSLTGHTSTEKSGAERDEENSNGKSDEKAGSSAS